MIYITITVCLLAYLMGSIPFALIIARAHGKDIRSIGSGNIGATNLSRACGRTWGQICFVLDLLKGLIPMLVISLWARPILMADGLSPERFTWIWIVCAVLTVVGHVFPLFAGFRGGKGVSTSFGATLGLFPYFTYCTLSAMCIWVITVKIWQYVSLASMVSAVSISLFMLIFILLIPSWSFSELWPLMILAVVFAVMVVLRHKGNIKRLLDGTEPRIDQKKRLNKSN